MQSVNGNSPHKLSTVLSAVFYDTLEAIFRRRRAQIPLEPNLGNLSEAAVSNRALGSTQRVFSRLLLRAIDYLPPGDITFADIGRAALAADRASDVVPPDRALVAARKDLARRFRDRGIVRRLSDLDGEIPAGLAVAPADLSELLSSDWAAFQWVDEHRASLGVPPEVPFTVLPRVDATKQLRLPGSPDSRTQRELILKVSWDHIEPNSGAVLGATKRRMVTGVTVALRWEDGAPLAVVRSDASSAMQRSARDSMLQFLVDQDLIGSEGSTEGGAVLRVMDGIAEVSGTQTLLHLAGEEW